MKPGKQSFNLPTSFVAPQFPAILRLWGLPASSVWSDKTDLLLAQLLVQGIAVIRLITYNSVGFFTEETVIKGFFDQFAFVRRGALNMYGDWKTMAVRNCHDLGPFATLSRSNT